MSPSAAIATPIVMVLDGDDVSIWAESVPYASPSTHVGFRPLL